MTEENTSSDNPYAPPKTPVEDMPEGGRDADIRYRHIGHEASLRSVGLLYYLGAFFLCGSGLLMLLGLSQTEGATSMFGGIIGGGIFMLGLGIALLTVGLGLRRLRLWVRIPAMALATLGLFSFPIGTLINGYILYLIMSEKGRMVFSEEYQRIIEATPEIRYRTPLIAWAFVILIIFLILSALLTPLLTQWR